MPIGAALGAAAVTAGGAVLSAGSTRRAADRASDTAAANTASNNALAREIYGQNSANLLPYSQSGMRAGNALNEMLLGPQPQGTMQYGQPQGIGDETWANGALQAMGLGSRGNSPATLQAHLNGSLEGPLSPQMMQAYQAYQQATPFTPPQAEPANGAAAPSAWDQFRNSTNYQFRLNEGMKAGNQGYAARGMLESGAAMRGLNDYAQNFASNELGNYQNLLAQQQGIGVGAVSALAGVGNTMVNNVTANNTSAAQAAANAALIRGQANSNMYGSIAGAIGSAAGSFGGSSYGK